MAEIEPARPLLTTAIAPEALAAVGALSLMVSTIVVGCHLFAVFRRSNNFVFGQNDPLLLVFFYGVVVIFLGVVLANLNLLG